MTEFSQLTRADASTMWPWLREHLRHHLRWWSDAHGLEWDDATLEGRIDAGRLIHREWAQLESASDDDFVRVARVQGVAVGVVYAEVRHDRFLGVDIGVLSWIYVDSAHRAEGLGARLLSAADTWMRGQGAVSAELYVTAPNTVAVHLYERWGLKVVDHRMMGRLPEP